jgi:hypothetical protein
MVRRTLKPIPIAFALVLMAFVTGHDSSAESPDSTATTSAKDSATVSEPLRVAPSTPAPMIITPGAKLFIERSDFGMALAASILKKQVPVVTMTDSSKSDFFIHTASNERVEKGGERIAKALVFGSWMGSGTHFNATVTITNRDGAVVFAHNSKKDNFQSAADNVAGKLKAQIAKATPKSQ